MFAPAGADRKIQKNWVVIFVASTMAEYRHPDVVVTAQSLLTRICFIISLRSKIFPKNKIVFVVEQLEVRR